METHDSLCAHCHCPHCSAGGAPPRDFVKSAAGISLPEESLASTKEGPKTALPDGGSARRVTFSCRDSHSFDAAVYTTAQLGLYAAFADPEPATETLEYFMEHPAWPNEGRITTAIMAWEDWMRRGKADFVERHYETLRDDRLMARYARESDGLLLTGGEYAKGSVVPGGGDVAADIFAEQCTI